MLNVNQRLILITILIAFVIGGIVYLYEHDKGRKVESIKVLSNQNTRFPVDLNNASAKELTAIPGIGVVKANAIVEYRKKIGMFTSISQLKEVKGIGPTTVEKISKYLKIDKPHLTGKIVESISDSERNKIDINTAGVDELMKIKYIGPKKAKAIVEYREKNGPFRSIRDIMKVDGIGPKTFERIKENIEVN